MLEINRTYENERRKIVYLGERRKIGRDFSEFIYHTKSEYREIMGQIFMPFNKIKASDEKSVSFGENAHCLHFIYNKNMFPKKFDRLKSIHDNAIKNLEQKTN